MLIKTIIAVSEKKFLNQKNMQPVPIQPYSVKIYPLKIKDINNLRKKAFSRVVEE